MKTIELTDKAYTEKRCRKCGIVKPVSEFYSLKSNAVDGYRYRCKQCDREYKQTHKENNYRYYQKHKEERARYSKEHYRKHKAGKLEYSHKYYQDNIDEKRRKGKIYRDTHKSQRREYDVKYYQANKLREAQRGKEYRLTHKSQTSDRLKRYGNQLSLEVLTHYGNGKPVCVECGYDDNILALSIDHINGNGRNHRDSLSTTKFYNWLRDNNYPEGFQTLCNNCQWVKRSENQEYYKQPKSKRAEYFKGYRQSHKINTLTHYGEGKLVCVRCGYDDIRALSIDHINGGGSKHRDAIHKTNMYVWLKKNGYPEGYQTLCMRCQWIKRDENKELEKIRGFINKP